MADRRQEIMDAAAERYGEDALFVYPMGRALAALSLQEAMLICGPDIEATSDEELHAKLAKWNAAANRLREERPELFEKSLELGRKALEARGLAQE